MNVSLEERFDRLEAIIRDKKILFESGYGKEITSYIFDYKAEYELYVRGKIEQLKARINKSTLGVEIKVFDLYNIVIDILKQEGFLEVCYDFEKRYGYYALSEAILDLLKITEGKASLIYNYIKERISVNTIVFLTGVGKCYPILRSHNIINNLREHLEETPIILFYPGKYDSQRLILFGKIVDDNHYKAKLLVD